MAVFLADYKLSLSIQFRVPHSYTSNCMNNKYLFLSCLVITKGTEKIGKKLAIILTEVLYWENQWHQKKLCKLTIIIIISEK